MNKVGLYCFTNDLRLHDNPALLNAASKAESMILVAIIDAKQLQPNRYGLTSLGIHRRRFLKESLTALAAQLDALGQQLHVIIDQPVDAISKLISTFNVDAIFSSNNAGYYENTYWQLLQQRYRGIHFEQCASHTLLSEQQLPFELTQLPSSFTKFKKFIERIELPAPAQTVAQLPPPPSGFGLLTKNDIANAQKNTVGQLGNIFKLHDLTGLAPLSHAYFNSPATNVEPVNKNTTYTQHANQEACLFKGGEAQALEHLQLYFSGDLPANYKQVRNALQGWENSTKLSAWLANGCLSPRTVISAVKRYEAFTCKNDSTYWIIFELLWREYFQWYAKLYHKKLFYFSGIKHKKPLTSFYAERFKKWCLGQTPYPIVNACMHQLNATGYMSNRGRQIVASCFVHELGLDWRYGAAYFEQQLVDYDVAANWGNWQYLAGVGADPRGSRRFNLVKQAEIYDPENAFINTWQGEMGSAYAGLDSVDAADWPI